MVKLTWKQMSAFQAGGAMCLPVMLAGYELCRKHGCMSSILALIAGNVILYLLALVSVHMSVTRRITTAENSVYYFGKMGIPFFSATLGIAKICWFAIQLNIIAVGLMGVMPNVFTVSSLNLIMGSIIIGLALLGIEGLSRFAMYILPLFIATVVAILYRVESNAVTHDMPLTLSGISIILAIAISRVIDSPTFFKDARSLKDSMITVTILYLGVLPLMEGLGIYLAHHQGNLSLLDGLLDKAHVAWVLWIAVFLAFSGWTANNTNLYSAVACCGTLLPRMHIAGRTLLAGGLGIGFALLNILNHFTEVLQILGLMIGTMGSVILTSYSLHRIHSPICNFIAWGAGLLVGGLAIAHVIQITTIPLLDGSLVSSMITLLLALLKQQERRYEIDAN